MIISIIVLTAILIAAQLILSIKQIKKGAPDLYEALKKRGLVHARTAERRLRIY